MYVYRVPWTSKTKSYRHPHPCGVKSTLRHQADNDCRMPDGGMSHGCGPHLVASLCNGAPLGQASLCPHGEDLALGPLHPNHA